MQGAIQVLCLPCTPRICNFALLFIAWVRSFSKMLPYVNFAEDKILVFTALRGMQTRFSDENSVCMSVRPSVCQTRAL